MDNKNKIQPKKGEEAEKPKEAPIKAAAGTQKGEDLKSGEVIDGKDTVTKTADPIEQKSKPATKVLHERPSRSNEAALAAEKAESEK